jgi:endonuclease/exonuclease/phosphatase family metal-dependent hydrolase
MVYAKELYEIIMFNSKLRINQLNEILKYNPDYIIGDFNFTPNDKEYNYLTQIKKYYTKLVDYTTPHNTQVDFIFSKTDVKLISRLNFQYSDHLPIIAIL